MCWPERESRERGKKKRLVSAAENEYLGVYENLIDNLEKEG